MAAPIPPLIKDWKDIQDALTKDWVAGTDPPAKREYLWGLNTLILQAATTPYASQAVQFPSARKGNVYWFWLQAYASAAWRVQGALVKGHDGDQAVEPVDIDTFATGEAGAFMVRTAPPNAHGADAYISGADQGSVDVIDTANAPDIVPAGTIDRHYQIDTPVLNPIVEEYKGLFLHGFAGRVTPASDLESL